MALERPRCPVCGRFLSRGSYTFDIDGMLLINESQVPESQTGKATMWDKVFEQIPEGKALVVPNNSANYQSVWNALKRQKAKGKFLHLRIVKRKMEGKITTYVVNPKGGKA